MENYEVLTKEEQLEKLLEECIDFLYSLPSPPLDLIQHIEKIMKIQ